MAYKIKNIRIKNFKCFNNDEFYEFDIKDNRSPFILSGPNGFGKTTFFDAIELVFTKSITRFNPKIEHGATKFTSNILLNDGDYDGYIVITFIGENKEYFTICVKILKDYTKLEIEESIRYATINEKVETNFLDDYLINEASWSEYLDINSIDYNLENFNIFYYVPQEESLHFLKKAMSDRKKSIDVLLKTSWVDDKLKIIDKLIKGNDGKLNKELAKIEEKINEQQSTYLEIIKYIDDYSNVESYYKDLGLYEKDKELYFWDNPDLSIYDTRKLEAGVKKITSLKYYLQYKDEYDKLLFNNRIDKILLGDAIKDYFEFNFYIKDGVIDKSNIEEKIRLLDTEISIYDNSKFFMDEKPNLDIYKRSQIEDLRAHIPEVSSKLVNLLDEMVRDIKHIKKNQSNVEKIYNQFIFARNNLRDSRNELKDESGYEDIIDRKCPYCNTEFESENELEAGFKSIEALLNENFYSNSKFLDVKIDRLNKIFQEIKGIIKSKCKYENEDAVKHIRKRLNDFLIEDYRINKVESLLNVIEIIDETKKNKNFQTDSDLELFLSNSKKNISTIDIKNISQEYGFENVLTDYKNEIEYMEKNISIQDLETKISYIKKMLLEKSNDSINNIRVTLRELLIRKNKIIYVVKDLRDIKSIYNSELRKYRNETIGKLKFPLLVYTGKILQDYQNGLGVFIAKDNMKFVSGGDDNHDILNTFSSGQLSAFIISFMLAMNKTYVNDDIGFILIDDPVQTMDDINIASFVEVLRNEFDDKQIILSTHEFEKENYILYKFYKYGKIGQSFNVKDELYGY